MYLSKILISNFRSYTQKLFEFDPRVNLIIGPNGSGKTNILEAIYLLSSGKSFRSSSLSSLIKWEQSFASVRGKINTTDETEIEVQLIKDPAKTNIQRRFLIDKVVKTRKQFHSLLKVVVFDPEDVRLVSGSPTRRRDYLDLVLGNLDWRYRQSLFQYHKALKHRNELLDLIFQQKASKSELFYWDQSIVKNSDNISSARRNFINSVNNYFSIHPNPEIKSLKLNYHASILTQDKLEANYELDLRRGHTQAGIHRDDFVFESSIFNSSDKNLSLWGSRGQQRLAVLALKLAEINYIEGSTGSKPVLLLDDIFSELDAPHQALVVQICDQYQSFFTSSDDTSIAAMPQAYIISLN